MAATSDNDASLTPAGTAVGKGLASFGDEADAEEGTVQQPAKEPPAPIPVPPMRRGMTRRPTVVGLGRPGPALPVTKPPTESELEEDSSISARPPLHHAASLLPLAMPLAVPVQIREMDDEEDGETAIRSLPEDEPYPDDEATREKNEAETAAPDPALDGPDAPDDSVTAEAELPPLSKPKALAERPLPRPTRQPLPAAGRPPSESPVRAALPRTDDTYSSEESVTTQGPPVMYGDDSVTEQAPVSRDDQTDSTTKKVKRRGLPPVDDAPSITPHQAGHLTNILRELAAGGSSPSFRPFDESDAVGDSGTVVMPDAPVKPVVRLQRRAVAATDDLSSDSGLRIAPIDDGSGEHASLGSILAGSNVSLAPPVPFDSAHVPVNVFANTETAVPAVKGPPRVFDFAATIGRRPRYVAIAGAGVALFGVLPLVLFLALRSGSSDLPPPRTPSELALDPVGRGDVARAKAPPPPAPPSASTPPAKPGRGAPQRGPWSPKRR